MNLQERLNEVYGVWSYQPLELAPAVTRLTCKNPSVFTGPGTNTWIVGNKKVILIDPGPYSSAEHTAKLAELCSENNRTLEAVLWTHTHEDHSPATGALLEKLGYKVPCVGMHATGGDVQRSKYLQADELPVHNKIVPYGDTPVLALATPGHASNHFCFLLEGIQMLFSGDHIMDGSTVVIGPPDGNMQHYIDSLNMLLPLGIKTIAPAHGHLISPANPAIEKLIAHRMKRENKVLAALTEQQAAHPEGLTAEALVPYVYDDVHPALHPIASSSLLAHLIKLQHNNVVRQQLESSTWILQK